MISKNFRSDFRDLLTGTIFGVILLSLILYIFLGIFNPPGLPTPLQSPESHQMPKFTVTVDIKADSQEDAHRFLNDANNGLYDQYQNNPKVEQATFDKSSLRPAPKSSINP